MDRAAQHVNAAAGQRVAEIVIGLICGGHGYPLERGAAKADQVILNRTGGIDASPYVRTFRVLEVHGTVLVTAGEYQAIMRHGCPSCLPCVVPHLIQHRYISAVERAAE